MKLKTSQLRQIIKEEVDNFLATTQTDSKEYIVQTEFGTLNTTELQDAIEIAKIWWKKGVLKPQGTDQEVLKALGVEPQAHPALTDDELNSQ
jgi:hypothetical protein